MSGPIMSTLIAVLQGLSLIAVIQLALGMGVFALLALLFKPLLTGCVRAAALAVKLHFAPKRAEL